MAEDLGKKCKECFWKIMLKNKNTINKNMEKKDDCVKCNGYNDKCPNYYTYDIQEK